MAHDTTVDSWQPAARIAGNTRANLKSAWLFTVLWNVLSAPVLVYIPPELHRNRPAALGFLFPIVGVGLLVWSITMTLRARRFGETWLEMTSGAASPGTTWGGAVHAQLPSPGSTAGYTVAVKLSCLLRTIRHGSDDRTVHERILWRDEALVGSDQISFWPESASIPVRFYIPADARETTAVGKGEGVLWVLTAEAALPGVDLKEDFDVVVRAVPGSPAVGRPGVPPPAARPVTIEELADTGVTVDPAPGGITYRFSAMRNQSFAAGLTAFTAIWTGAIWLQWYLGFPWFFPLVTALVDVLLIAVAVDLWLGSTTTTVSAGTVRRRHSILGLGSTRTLSAAEIARLDLNINMQTEGRYGTPYYELRATLKTGRKVSLGGGLRSKRQAEWLAAQMRSEIGLAPATRQA